jgi:addiction module RelE/StbE family toxin
VNRIRWTRSALAHLDEIGRHIAEHNPAAAGRVVERIVALVSHLSELPQIGRLGRVAGTRELVVPDFPYIIAYRLHARDVEVLAVFHALRRWPNKL